MSYEIPGAGEKKLLLRHGKKLSDKSIAGVMKARYIHSSKLLLKVPISELLKTLPMNTHETVRAIRCFKGYSQEYMAHRLGMTQKNYSKYERGENKLTVEHLEKIAGIFNMKAKDLLSGSENKLHGINSSDSLDNRVCKLEEQLTLLLGVMKQILSGGGGNTG